MLTFCTLFDENYLDKGLVLHRSLERVCADFTLYILCMSNRCYEVLSDLHYQHIHPISLQEFEYEVMLQVKKQRSVAEYCWTCSSAFTQYVIEHFHPDYCTYLDADMRFYDNPQVIIDEMVRRNASVSIVGHRFNKNVAKEKSHIVGKYCVECNTFKNDDNGRHLLSIWVNQCLDHCSTDGDGIHWADQKYLDNWVDDYSFVIELENLGAGVAPWNISQYRLVYYDEENIFMKCKGNKYKLLFYHFEGITYPSPKIANIKVFHQWGVQDSLVFLLYDQYLSEIDFYKRMLKSKYGIDNIIKHHPGIAKVEKNSFGVRIKHLFESVVHLNMGKYLKDLPSFILGKKDFREIMEIERV